MSSAECLVGDKSHQAGRRNIPSAKCPSAKCPYPVGQSPGSILVKLSRLAPKAKPLNFVAFLLLLLLHCAKMLECYTNKIPTQISRVVLYMLAKTVYKYYFVKLWFCQNFIWRRCGNLPMELSVTFLAELYLEKQLSARIFLVLYKTGPNQSLLGAMLLEIRFVLSVQWRLTCLCYIRDWYC